MRNEVPDRVPVAPDISHYIPLKRSGLPFWEVYFKGARPHWQLYLEAVDYFGSDAWVASILCMPFTHDPSENKVEWRSEDAFDKDRDAMLRRAVIRTPDGEMTSREICFRREPPAATEKLIKDLDKDFKKYKWLIQIPTGIDMDRLGVLQAACEQRQQAFGVCICIPGFQNWNSHVEGGIATLSYAEMDCPEILEEWFELDMEQGTRQMELILQCPGVDYILFGASGTITLASPALARKYALPALKKFSAMARAGGIPTMIHSCGKNRILADMLVEDTDVLMINPLEVPPMGDIDLAELNRTHGQRLSFMGNLHTTDVMLNGTPEVVMQKSIEAMRDAGPGGGFILSTGDQCGRETPDENLFAIVEAAKKYGRYDQATGTLPDLPDVRESV